MIALIQRVQQARVEVDGEVTGQIDRGLLVYLGVAKEDDDAKAARLCERVLGYRVFEDEDGKMNRDVRDCGGQILLVSQFTLAADTKKGRRPSFSSAAPPEEAERLYQVFIEQLKSRGAHVATGIFGANMQVHSINDGPINFNLTV